MSRLLNKVVPVPAALRGINEVLLDIRGALDKASVCMLLNDAQGAAVWTTTAWLGADRASVKLAAATQKLGGAS